MAATSVNLMQMIRMESVQAHAKACHAPCTKMESSPRNGVLRGYLEVQLYC